MQAFLDYALEILPDLFNGLGLTLFLGSSSFIFALILGLILLIIYSMNIKVINNIIRIYVSFFRGTPLLMQLFLFYYGLPVVINVLAGLDKNWALIISMSLNSSAYIFEILRGAIEAIDKGQYEASVAFGMTNYQTLTRIVFPQAIVAVFPSLINSYMDMIKMSSIGMTIGLQELTGRTQMISASSYRITETYIIAIIIYWILSIFFSYIQKNIEKNIGKIYRR